MGRGIQKGSQPARDKLQIRQHTHRGEGMSSLRSRTPPTPPRKPAALRPRCFRLLEVNGLPITACKAMTTTPPPSSPKD